METQLPRRKLHRLKQTWVLFTTFLLVSILMMLLLVNFRWLH